jgi:hypothetical protein
MNVNIVTLARAVIIGARCLKYRKAQCASQLLQLASSVTFITLVCVIATAFVDSGFGAT